MSAPRTPTTSPRGNGDAWAPSSMTPVTRMPQTPRRDWQGHASPCSVACKPCDLACSFDGLVPVPYPLGIEREAPAGAVFSASHLGLQQLGTYYETGTIKLSSVTKVDDLHAAKAGRHTEFCFLQCTDQLLMSRSLKALSHPDRPQSTSYGLQ